MRGRDWLLAGGIVRPPVPRPWVGECAHPGCGRTPGPNGLCAGHDRRYRELGMTVKAGTHIRSLRMPPELAAATTEAARRLRMPENRFICQAVREVCRQAGIPVEEPAHTADDLGYDPFA